jgi:hypothetical protein
MLGKKPVRASTLTHRLCDNSMLKYGQWNGHAEKVDKILLYYFSGLKFERFMY